MEFNADVLALKYAQGLYGVDLAVHERLTGAGSKPKLPKLGDVSFCNTGGAIAARTALFVGVRPLHEFDYGEIRAFAQAVLAALVSRNVRHLALTIHGPGYGLDEVEAFVSELAGITEAATQNRVPESLELISFVERDERRARRLTQVLVGLLPDGVIDVGRKDSRDSQARRTLQAAGTTSEDKPHIFVAMSFAHEMDDVFHYGIQGPVNKVGMLCERADLSTFTGDVMDWVKRRIASAKLVIAELSTSNPNVYLEVGYAWGRDVPTVLLAKKDSELKFDVKSQRCILYSSIQHLEQSLTRELQILAPAGRQRPD